MTRPGALGEIETAVEAQADALRALGVRSLAVFGSAARGELRPDSDVDVLYEFAPEDATPVRIEALGDLLEASLGREVDLVPARHVGPVLSKWIGDERRVVFRVDDPLTATAP